MPLIPHAEVIQERLDALPLVTVEAGGAVFLAGSRTDRLLFLKKGSVVVIKDGAEIARVTQPRAVFAELDGHSDHSRPTRATELSRCLLLRRTSSAHTRCAGAFFSSASMLRRLTATRRVAKPAALGGCVRPRNLTVSCRRPRSARDGPVRVDLRFGGLGSPARRRQSVPCRIENAASGRSGWRRCRKAIENIERTLGPSHYTARALLTS